MLSDQGIGIEQKQEPGCALTPICSHHAVDVCQVSKHYLLYEKPHEHLKHILLSPFRKSRRKDFFALHEISFQIERGETFGIIGRNGAGKSTLLQILAGILQPSSGTVTVQGRVASILELGSGFNPDYSGRENVMIGGTVMGFSYRQMEEKFDEIAAFADIDEFIDQPIRHYSTGMLARLAFALQSCVEPDILIIDEALSVGDIFFQQKCAERMQALSDKGTTIILVSHDPHVIRTMCQRALLLDRGKMLYCGDSVEAIRTYHLLQSGNHAGYTVSAAAPAIIHEKEDFTEQEFLSKCQWIRNQTKETENYTVYIQAVSIQDEFGNPTMTVRMGNKAYIYTMIHAMADQSQPYHAISLRNRYSQVVFSSGNLIKEIDPPILRQGQSILCRMVLECGIEAGQYTIHLSFGQKKKDDSSKVEYEQIPSLGPLTVEWNYLKDKAPFLGAYNMPFDISYFST